MSPTFRAAPTAHKKQTYKVVKIENKLIADLKKNGILIKSDRQNIPNLRTKP